MARPPKLLQTSVKIEVPFHDVDLMEVVWHGHYVKYFEIARCALLESCGYNYPQMKESGFAWPVVDMRIRYPSPATFGETITVCAWVSEWEHRLKVEYEIRNCEGQRLTRGYTVQVAVDIVSGEMCFESPPVLLEKLGLGPGASS
ncbi:acyl-CoA thioesterase [Gilvimarinus sp. F26214L]|uniref:acyl-CoA thioesterase n=1 Tax=Gilvimarinus sp. DZF01 TaxID=3461371 RepID=UPI004045EAED